MTDLLPEPVPQPEAVAIDDVSTEYVLLRTKLAQLKALEKEVEKLKQTIKERMGDAEEATILGEVVITNHLTATFRGAQFTKEYPTLAKEYTRGVVRYELDKEALQAAHPSLYWQYQSRVFLIKDV